MVTLSGRSAWLVAATSGLWVTVLLLQEWPHDRLFVAVLGCWFVAATWMTTRRPWPGVLLVAAGLLGLGLRGLAPENAAPLGPLMITPFLAGYLLPRRLGVGTVPVLVIATAPSTGWDPPSVVFEVLLLSLTWGFGTLVRGRDVRRRAAAQEATRLALVDPHARAREVASPRGTEPPRPRSTWSDRRSSAC